MPSEEERSRSTATCTAWSSPPVTKVTQPSVPASETCNLQGLHDAHTVYGSTKRYARTQLVRFSFSVLLVLMCPSSMPSLVVTFTCSVLSSIVPCPFSVVSLALKITVRCIQRDASNLQLRGCAAQPGSHSHGSHRDTDLTQTKIWHRQRLSAGRPFADTKSRSRWCA